MPPRLRSAPYVVFLFLTSAGVLFPLISNAAAYKTQSQMAITERDAILKAARSMAGDVQGGCTALQGNKISAVAADFAAIESSVNSLRHVVQKAAITVDRLYLPDASAEPVGSPRTDFYCGTPAVVLNFTELPPGQYAVVILHAAGVPQPHQISLILSETGAHRWLLPGFFTKPMIEAGRDGLWYWTPQGSMRKGA